MLHSNFHLIGNMEHLIISLGVKTLMNNQKERNIYGQTVEDQMVKLCF